MYQQALGVQHFFILPTNKKRLFKFVEKSQNQKMKEPVVIFVFSNKGGANIALIISSHYVGVPGVIIGCYYVIMGTALPDLCLVREATGRGGSEENCLCLK